MQITGIKETILYVHDLAQARAFYTETLGLTEHTYVPDKLLFYAVGDDMLLMFNPEASQRGRSVPRHYGGGEQHFCFECPLEAYADWKHKLVDQGIAIEHEQEWGTGRKSFYFRDPEDNSLEIAEPGIWGGAE